MSTATAGTSSPTSNGDAPPRPVEHQPSAMAGDAFDRALASFAEAYADQNERDYAAFSSAVHPGKIAAETGQ